MEEREAQKDAEDFAAFEREQEMEMENARARKRTGWRGEAVAATAPSPPPMIDHVMAYDGYRSQTTPTIRFRAQSAVVKKLGK